MSRVIPYTRAAKRAASAALLRTCTAFGLDRNAFRLDVSVTEPSGETVVALAYDPGNGRTGLAQRRDLPWFHDAAGRLPGEVRSAVDEMVWQVATAFRSEVPPAPTGWSIHPVAASVIAASSHPLPTLPIR